MPILRLMTVIVVRAFSMSPLSDLRKMKTVDGLTGYGVARMTIPLAGHRYQIRLDASGDKVILITLLGRDGESVDRREQQALLTLLRGNIT
jgi:hypothetical protein